METSLQHWAANRIDLGLCWMAAMRAATRWGATFNYQRIGQTITFDPATTPKSG